MRLSQLVELEREAAAAITGVARLLTEVRDALRSMQRPRVMPSESSNHKSHNILSIFRWLLTIISFLIQNYYCSLILTLTSIV